MTRLSVNINKIATLRNARGGNMPDVIQVAKDCEAFGAQGITVHPRPDERHIRYNDVYLLKPIVTTEFNIEGYPSESFIELVLKIKPEQVTLVPDPPDAITSNKGWDTKENLSFLKNVIETFKANETRVSVFVDPIAEMVKYAKKAGADRVELYTESYAEMYCKDRDLAVKPFVEAANAAKQEGIGLNAGHDLNLDNIRFLSEKIPNLLEVSIGHALICESLYLGLQKTIQLYLERLKK